MAGIYSGEEIDFLNVLAISSSLTKLHPHYGIYDRGVILKIGVNGDMNIQTQYISFVTNLREMKTS